ncbi:hypothetical protein [Xanthocytophaga agilis]|uniref:Uncharacterized protein n=1 Tax=Xanthocytophaga agilis TaxID=3048010 RepID=A0AAE3QYJ0_9BACT|nr:hypothetical protein [Xanthocytophaga agilis]MDJ1500456.1 hypothetical protein [Xanthocytophaga agilis]
MRHAEYNQYFRDLATKHVDIKHSDTEMHFARIIRSADPFFKLELSEFLTKLKSKLETPFMLLETYDARFEDNKSDNKWQLAMGAFMILDKVSKGDYNEVESKLDFTESVATDIIGRLYNDYKLKRINWHVDLNDITLEKVGPVGDSMYGTRVDFLLKTTANTSLKYDPSKFL